MNATAPGHRLRGPLQVEIIAYAPTEFFHCRHCELVWNHLDIGQRLHAEQRQAGLLPPDLQAEYAAISDWIAAVGERYGEQVRIRLVDAVSIEGFLKSVRHISRQFPVFVIDGAERISGFDRSRLDRALARRLEETEVMPSR